MAQPKISILQTDIDLSSYATQSYTQGLLTTAASSAGNIQYFTSSGTFTVPTGITRVKVQVIGGGGAGNATTFLAGNIWMNGGGGGGGGFGEGVFTVTPGATIAVTIGAAGIANGGTGGTTSFGSFITATGGLGGSASSGGGHEGLGGTSTGGSISIQGQGDNITINTTGQVAAGPYGGLSGYGKGGDGFSANTSGNGSNGRSGICIVQW